MAMSDLLILTSVFEVIRIQIFFLQIQNNEPSLLKSFLALRCEARHLLFLLISGEAGPPPPTLPTVPLPPYGKPTRVQALACGVTSPAEAVATM